MAKTPLFKSIKRNLKKAQLKEVERDLLSEQEFNRRKFLKGGLLATAGTLLVHPFNPSLAQNKKSNLPKINVIGAGIAGLTCAYRLMKAGIPCQIFESSPRVGGRIFTKHNFNDQGMFCELGAELVNTNHKAMWDLSRELNVPMESFEAWGGERPGDYYFFNNQIYTDKQMVEAFKPLAKLIAADQNLLEDENHAKKFDWMSLDQYLYSMRGKVESWVLEALDVAYSTEMGLDTHAQSALTFLWVIGTEDSDEFKVFGESDELYRIKGGNSNLIYALHNALKEGGVPINLSHQLVHIKDNGSQKTLTFKTQGKTKEVKSTQTVMTAPFSSLRWVDGVSQLSLTPEKRELILKLGQGTNCKHMMGFKSPFWLKKPGNNGIFFTDLPIQSCWDTSRLQKGNKAILTNYLGGKIGAQLNRNYLDSKLPHFERFFPGAKSQFSGEHATHHWPSYQHAFGSYVCPLPGQYSLMEEHVGTTELGGRLHFAGEHTSVEHWGYMNGGADSGNRAAKDIMAKLKVRAATDF